MECSVRESHFQKIKYNYQNCLEGLAWGGFAPYPQNPGFRYDSPVTERINASKKAVKGRAQSCILANLAGRVVRTCG